MQITLRLPWLRADVGLGTALKRISTALGIRPCAPCAARAETFDRHVTFAPPRPAAFADCTTYTGRCTGFGSRQCVTAPESLNPDAATTTQCCGGWFQYPWITACRTGPVQKGCGFCLW